MEKKEKTNKNDRCHRAGWSFAEAFYQISQISDNPRDAMRHCAEAGCESYVRSVNLITIVHHVEVKHGAVFRLADLNKPCGERSLRTVYGRVGSPVVWMANASAASQRHSSPRNFSMGPCHR